MPSHPVAKTSLAEIGIEVARDLASKRFARIVARMDARMAEALTAAKLAEIWSGLVEQIGPFDGLGDCSVEAGPGFTRVRVTLKFLRGALDLQLSFVSDQIAGVYFVPHETPAPAASDPAYVDRSAFGETEVGLGAAPGALPGALSLPNAPSPAPAVILVHGSGPRDRDATIGPNRPFRDLAHGLASRGIAVLRYEKRTKAYPESFVGLANPTVREETLDDVALAIELLKSRREIDPERIVVVGHSLGGTLAPRIAELNPSLAKIVILAGATRNLLDVTVEQVKYLASLKGDVDAATAKKIRDLETDAARVRAARPGDEGEPFLGAPLSYWADLNVYDPVATAARLTIPILALQGGRDYQVTTEDFARFREAFGGKVDAETKMLPSLNHLFMTGVGKSTPSEYLAAGHVDAEAIDIIAKFVLAPRRARP